MRIRAIANGLAVALGVLILHLVLVMPSHPAGLTASRFLRPTTELPLLLTLLALLPGRMLRAALVLLAVGLIVLRVSNLGTYLAFSRPFNPLLDLHLLVSGWSLLASSIGRLEAAFGIAAILLAIALAAAALWVCLFRLSRVPPWARAAPVILAAAPLGLSYVTPGWSSFSATPVVAEQIGRMGRGVADLAEFTEELRTSPSEEATFAALEGRDVILAFIESYGRTFLDAPDYGDLSGPRLSAVGETLGDAGWHARSAWTAAPTRGGQSWLAHGTLLSGLWTDSQVRYDRLMTSERMSLNALFGAAGWRTGAAMPAITLDWPEAGWFGYDITLDADGLGYAGEPFEWVTMPDQYTWSAMDRLLRGPGPDMIELALVTSHAPWTPLPRIVPWEDIGDGAIFDGQHRDGESPREVWSDPDRIRAQYAMSLDYALEVTGQYIAGFGDGALFIVLGDHQPAPLLTGQDAPPDVPIHIIADDPALLDRLPAEIFTPGLIPKASAPVLPMDALRPLLSTVFERPLTEPNREN
ncbi:sulfatase [Roseicyclus sp. F158]|uniref:Sulfatase n=1 Tax=Tropicimonas omnivorans TaxID=3075590 RepID=A0ABU3DIH2_9RHOB|nr:sulfatase [Roseicyclus sp. F158]MDT0683339.1 sulfatase [Roseicyclus sp. F158]